MDNAVFLSDAVKYWWKILLDSKYERTSTTEDAAIDFLIKSAPYSVKIRYIEDVKDYFFLNFRNGYAKLSPELKEFIAGNIFEIPDDIRDMLSKDTDENVRLAIANNRPPIKVEIPIAVPPDKEEKKGFFGKLFR
jgi:hypothetical protein